MKYLSTAQGAWRYSLLLGTCLLGACSVYVPMQGAAPDIRHKGEAELAGSWSLTNRLELGATYSPAAHVLVRAAASFKGSRPTPGDTISHAQNNQYELGVGTYWPLGSHWLVGGLAGFGRASVNARYQDDGAVELYDRGTSDQHQFAGSYNKYAGEAYVAWQATAVLSLGLSYRLVRLRLADITDLGQSVQAGPILRQEPMLFVRLRPAYKQGLVQLQGAVGGSGTLNYDERTANDHADPARQFKLARSYVSLGIALYPHLLRQKK